MNYGMPYKGSKSRIAEIIIRHLPPARHFYDLFGGGGAMTHCALLSGKYKYVHYNELDPLVFKGFEMFVSGDFKSENRWISRENFQSLKKTDPYVALCFSFGNNFRTYLYGTSDREQFKKSAHYSICFDDSSLLSEYIDLSGFSYTSESAEERRLELQRYLTELYRENRLNPDVCKYLMIGNGSVRNVSQNLLNLERLNEFSASGFRNVILTNKSYEDIDTEPDSVIYCDPPYTGTEQYRNRFSVEKFCEWLRQNENQVFVSEYSMPPDFTEVFAVQKQCRLNDKGSKSTTERLFTNRLPEF